MVDPTRLGRLLSRLEEYRSLLAESTTDVYRRRYLVQTAAQICIDLAQHVIASEGFRPPNGYADAFTVLAEEDVIETHLSTRLRDLAGARNVIAHLYAEVDDERLARSLVEGGLTDLSAFARAIASLESEG